jgi:hypothetical protein
MATKVVGSVELTPKSRLLIKRVRAKAAANPLRAPTIRQGVSADRASCRCERSVLCLGGCAEGLRSCGDGQGLHCDLRR